MRISFKNKFVRYFISILGTGLLAEALAIGPCGGAIIGFVIALMIGITFSATIWLLDFNWYWNLLICFFLNPIVLATSFFLIRIIPIGISEYLAGFLTFLLIVFVFVGYTELINQLLSSLFPQLKKQLNQSSK